VRATRRAQWDEISVVWAASVCGGLSNPEQKNDRSEE